MENQISTSIDQNVNDTSIFEIPDYEEDKGDHLYNHIAENPASPSSTTTDAEMMDCSQESPENSRSNSVASQHEADGEIGSSSEHSAEDDHPFQGMDPMSPTQEDKDVEDRTFENNIFCPPGFQLRRSQSNSSNSPTSLKFPHSSNLRETDNFEEDYEIFLFVKVRAWMLFRVH